MKFRFESMISEEIRSSSLFFLSDPLDLIIITRFFFCYYHMSVYGSIVFESTQMDAVSCGHSLVSKCKRRFSRQTGGVITIKIVIFVFNVGRFSGPRIILILYSIIVIAD